MGLPARVVSVGTTLDTREYALCDRIAKKASAVLQVPDVVGTPGVLNALRHGFDERIVAEHLRVHHKLNLDVGGVLASLRNLAEQSYENKALSFGCLLDPNLNPNRSNPPSFPDELLKYKKYRALSDGFQTAYHISNKGHLVGFVNLESNDNGSLSSRHFYPYWSENFAKASRDGICGVSLTRSGDILIFDQASLRFTYRRGTWQYWNHAHLIDLLSGLGRAQRVPPSTIGRLVSFLYQIALDVSFRHSGGLLVVLRNVKNLSRLVQPGDTMWSDQREVVDAEFDAAIGANVSRPILAELAGLDGAIVITNDRRLRAHAAILKQGSSGRKLKAEGSRTKAAHSASKYGLAIKISSDGDIVVYFKGKEFIHLG